jgi:hypothetical protein
VLVGALQVAGAGSATALPVADCGSAVPPAAPNLVQNCGFETGDLTGWTESGDTAFTGVNAGLCEGDDEEDIPGDVPFNGTNYMAFGAIGGDTSLSQTITGTAPGETYRLSFWLQTPAAFFNANISAVVHNTATGDVTAVSLNDPGQFAYTQEGATFRTRSDGGAPVLEFVGHDGDCWFDLDEIEVVAIHTVTFNSEGGLPAASTQVVDDGTPLEQPADPQLDGCDFCFDAWNTAADGSGTWWDFDDPVNEDMTLYAQYLPIGPPEGGTGGTQTTSAAVSLVSSGSQSVYGQPVTFTVTVGPSSPVKACSVLEWIVDGVRRGPDVPVTSGTNVGGALQFTLGPISDLSVGQNHVKATFPGCVGVSDSDVAQQVVKSPSTTTVTYAGGAATATVHAAAPGAGNPAGSVTFFVNGVPATTAPLALDDTATAVVHVPFGEALTATYSGDDNFAQSSGARTGAVLNPLIAARTHSGHARTAAGWYRGAVTVSFQCKQGTSHLTSSCPAAVKLSKSRAGQSVTRAIKGADGGRASITVSHINIDRVAPSLRVRRHGHHVSCHATDALSGVASCVVHLHSHTRGGVTHLHWVATATDKAGNTTTKRGHFAYVSP